MDHVFPNSPFGPNLGMVLLHCDEVGLDSSQYGSVQVVEYVRTEWMGRVGFWINNDNTSQTKLLYQFDLNSGVAYGFPDAKGFGGTTTTGEVARKIFKSEILRERIVQLCPELYRPAMRRILFNDLILLRLMSCEYKLLPDKIGKISDI